MRIKRISQLNLKTIGKTLIRAKTGNKPTSITIGRNQKWRKIERSRMRSKKRRSRRRTEINILNLIVQLSQHNQKELKKDRTTMESLLQVTKKRATFTETMHRTKKASQIPVLFC